MSRIHHISLLLKGAHGSIAEIKLVALVQAGVVCLELASTDHKHERGGSKLTRLEIVREKGLTLSIALRRPLISGVCDLSRLKKLRDKVKDDDAAGILVKHANFIRHRRKFEFLLMNFSCFLALSKQFQLLLLQSLRRYVLTGVEVAEICLVCLA